MAVTLALFPFLYLTLELPKRIINDAIGAGQSEIDLYGFTLSQTSYLGLLCVGFLLAVLLHGVLKMRINTMKGVLAERMLRRFRYQLVTRLFRFPKPFFQRTSQAEIVSMVTAESEPLGGMMGDAISQPVLQAGQMLTILAFLFLQSFWFGLAAVALIPLQAWIIPKLQRRINVLNKARIKQVRRLAAEIGETAAGASDLRTSAGHPLRAAQITDRLGTLFFIRLDIYQKKFFMKFLNNFITQLTPFFFFSIGGYLVIQGQVTIGALVAALAAYKDLSSPWKELLTYYNMSQEMSQRWTLITDHFAPAGRLDPALVGETPTDAPRLTGDVVLSNLRARDADGNAVIDGIDLSLPAGGLIGIAAKNDDERQAMSELLTRELIPSDGRIQAGDTDFAKTHQGVIGMRIGHADANPYLFEGTVGENIFLPLKSLPQDTEVSADERFEATRTGNSRRLLSDQWLDPSIAGLASEAEVETWWLTLMRGCKADAELVDQGLGLSLDGEAQPDLAQAIVDLRPKLTDRLSGDGLSNTVLPFEVDSYNPLRTLMDNILFAVPTTPVEPRVLAGHPDFITCLQSRAIIPDVAEFARAVVDLLQSTFGEIGTDHPLFQRLGLEVATFEDAVKFNDRAKADGFDTLVEAEQALLLAVACVIPPSQIGRLLPVELQDKVVAQRDGTTSHLSDMYTSLDAGVFAPGLSLIENLAFGAINRSAGPRVEMLNATAAAVLAEAGLTAQVARLTLAMETRLGGSNLSARVRERIGYARAAIKKPDILVLNGYLASYEPAARKAAVKQLRRDLPDTTLVVLSDSFEDPSVFDLHVTLHQGKVSDDTASDDETHVAAQPDAADDLAGKLAALEQTVFFGGVEKRQLRLLAFSAQHFEIPAGEIVFRQNDDPSDGAYLIQSGEADFIAPNDDGPDRLVRTVGPGSLVGELALILGEPRTLSMQARTDITGLRIGGEEFITVLQNDAKTAFKMMQLVTGYLSKVPSKK